MAGKRRADGPQKASRVSPKSPKSPKSTGSTTTASEDSTPKTWKRRLWTVTKWSGVTLVVLALVAVAGFVYLYKTIDIPDPNKDFLANASIVYYDGAGDEDGEELGRYALQNRESIPLSEMPDNVKQAVVAAEDQSFYTNNGIDTKGILRAVFNNAKGGSTQGASTITQQYVKILYLTQERSYQRKVKEAILSLKIQREYSKDQVLEGYLNTIYFGRGAYGVQAAADAYFAKPAKDLDLRQAAVLASVLNDPNDLDPSDGKDARQALKGRYAYVLDQMAETGDITAAEAEQAARRLPRFPRIEAESTYGGQKGHMLTLIKDQLLGLKQQDGTPFTEDLVDGGGLRIHTTLQREAMEDIEAGVEEVRPTEGEGFTKPDTLHVAAATVEPGTGALRGFYAGQDYLESELNWAVAGGQAGSTFKAYAVAAGLKDGYALKDTFDGNSPITVGDTEFENQGDSGSGSSGGAISLLAATEDSVNTAFIDLTDSMTDGPEKIIEMAEAMGIPPAKASRKNPFGIPTTSGGLKPETGVALGSATVSPINMANGYATIAAQGEAAPVYVIDRVEDSTGDVLYQHKVTTKRAVSADISADVSYALQQVVASSAGTGYEAAMDDGRPVAGKTGTATKTGGAVSSSWFVGFTPQLSTAVMYVRGTGNGQLDDWLPASEDGRAGFYGGNYPAKTWKAIMTRELDGVPVEEFPEPAYVDGEAPDDGHAPYTPPPPPPVETTKPPEPTTSEPTTSEPTTSEPTTTEPTTEPPTSEPTVEPTTEPPTGGCGLLTTCPPDDPTTAPTPDPTPPGPGTPSATPRPALPGRED